jgi:hypothetical protein
MERTAVAVITQRRIPCAACVYITGSDWKIPSHAISVSNFRGCGQSYEHIITACAHAMRTRLCVIIGVLICLIFFLIARDRNAWRRFDKGWATCQPLDEAEKSPAGK